MGFGTLTYVFKHAFLLILQTLNMKIFQQPMYSDSSFHSGSITVDLSCPFKNFTVDEGNQFQMCDFLLLSALLYKRNWQSKHETPLL